MCLQPSAEFRKYIKVEFDGIENTDGFIAEVLDEASGLVDAAATIGTFFRYTYLG